MKANLTSYWKELGHFARSIMAMQSFLTTQALVTVLASRIVDTLETSSSGTVAVANGVRVHIAIALALLAFPRWPKLASGVTEVTVSTDLTFWPWKNAINQLAVFCFVVLLVNS